MNKDLQKRLVKYVFRAMQQKFPQFKLFEGDGQLRYIPRGAAFWGGQLKNNFGVEYSVAIVYPLNFPQGQIKAYVTELMGVSTPHKYVDGHLCLYSNDHGGEGEGTGAETTAVTVVAWAAAWLNAWGVYQHTGTWPGK